MPALDALRGASFNADPQARVDREAVRRFYTTPVTRVTAINESRRSGRRFVHVRLDVDDIRPAGRGARPSRGPRTTSGRTTRSICLPPGDRRARPDKPAGDAGWNGREVVAFRLHLPSKIDYHNAGAANLKRGNILVWEQSLTDRLRGMPLVLDARMQTQSILYSALTLFGVDVRGRGRHVRDRDRGGQTEWFN